MMHLAFADVSRFLVQAFFSGLWQGLALVAAVTLILRCATGLSSSTRYIVWWLAFGLGFSLPLLHLPLSYATSAVVTAPRWQVGLSWGMALAGCWMALTLFRAIGLAQEAFQLRRIWRRAEPVDVPVITPVLRRAPVSAELCISGDVAAPSVIGFFAPRLLIPASLYGQLTPEELKQIVLHEMEHLRRRDDWINLFQKLALVLFPLNPALFWMDRRLGVERELACDAGVVASTAQPFDYARCLTRLAEHRLLCRGIALSLSAWGRRPELVERVAQLIRPTKRWTTLSSRLCTVAICACLIVAGLGMAASPRIVSVAEPVATLAGVATFRAAPPAIRSVPVAYHPALPQTARTKTVLLSAHPRRRATQRAGFRDVRATLRHAPQPRMLLTNFSVQHRRPSTALSTLPQPQPVAAFAAVQFDNGWLIIQL